MNPCPPMAILSAGAVTSVGLSLAATSSAIRAAVDNFQDTQFFGPKGEPLMGARVDLCLPQEADGALVGGAFRLAQMVSLAVEECLRDQPYAETAILLVLPDQERPLDIQRLAESCERVCLDHLGRRPLSVRHFTQGAVGCLAALREARSLLERDRNRRVLVVGADTWLTTPSIQQALAQNRLLTSDKSDGFIPGEGAAAILLGPPSHAGALLLKSLGIGEEPATLFSDDPCVGKGLAQAIAAAFKEAGLEPHQATLRIADTTGEEYFFVESAYAWGRVMRADQPEGHQFLLPASRVGEVGAAAGILSLAYLWHLNRVDRLPGPHSMVFLSSAGPQRGAIATSVN